MYSSTKSTPCVYIPWARCFIFNLHGGDGSVSVEMDMACALT